MSVKSAMKKETADKERASSPMLLRHTTMGNSALLQAMIFLKGHHVCPSSPMLQTQINLKQHRQPKRTMCGLGLQRTIWWEYTRIITVLSDAK